VDGIRSGDDLDAMVEVTRQEICTTEEVAALVVAPGNEKAAVLEERPSTLR